MTLQKQTFAALQPVCSRLLASRSDAVQLTALLVELRQLLEAANLEGLKGCVDYVLFPLQLALDAVAATRGTDTPGDSSAAVALPALASDKAAEAALAALLALMRRCPCDKPEQLLALLQRLSAVLAAPREKMSEELRLCALEILEAVLRDAVPGVLAEEDTAPLLGLLISLLLKCAHAELQAGTSGSKTVRTHALRALRLLVQAVDSPEALTFFLPGLVTGLGKALLDASGGRAARGGAAFAPAASGSAAVEALQCLVAVLLCTLGNAAVAGLEEESEEGQEGASKGIGALKLGLGGGPAAALSSEEALASLASLAEKAKAPPGGGQNNTGLELAANEAPPALPPMPPRSSGDGAASRLRVERSLAWVQASAGRVKELLEVLVPRIAADPRPPVRVALVEGKHFKPIQHDTFSNHV